MKEARVYEFYGNGFQGRFRLGEEITQEMLSLGSGVTKIEKFISKKVLEPVEGAKEGEPKFKETEVEEWAPGFVRLGDINIIYEIA